MSHRRIVVLLIAAAGLAIALWLGWQGRDAAPQTDGRTATERTTASSELLDESSARATPPTTATPRPTWRVRGALALGGRPIADARMVAYAGTRRDRQLAFSALMDEAARGDMSSFRLDVDSEPVAIAAVAADGTFAFETDRRDLRLVLENRYWALPNVLPVHLPEAPGDVDIGTLDAQYGGHVIGHLVGGSVPIGTDVTLVADLNPMSVLEDPSAFMAHSLRGGGATTEIREGGRFEFLAVTPSPSITVSLDSDEVPARSERFQLAAGETREIVLRRVPTGTVEALIVRGDDRKPLEGARVSAVPLDEPGEIGRRRGTRRKRTDATGNASFSHLPLGTYRIIASHRDCRPSDIEVVVGTGDDTRVALALDVGGVVRGRIVDSAGTPIEGAGVETMPEIEIPLFGDATELMGRDILARIANDAHCRSAADGSFELRGVPHDRSVALAAAHAEFAGSVARDVHAGDAGLELVLEPLAELSGRVIDRETGAPIRTFTAKTKVRMALFIERASATVEVIDSEDGAFTMRGLTPGSATLEIAAAGYGAHEQKIAVESDDRIDLGVIELERAAVIHGRVVDPDGAPVPGALVSPRQGGMLDNPIVAQFFGDAALRTASDGSFEMTGVKPGRLILQATAPGFAKGTSRRLRMAAGDTLEDVEIELGTAGSVTGRLILPFGRSTDGWRVLAVQDVRGAVGSTNIGDDGSFRIDGLDPGAYQIQGLDVDSFSRVTVDMQSATESGELPDIGGLMRSIQDLTVSARAVVRAGETTEVELDASDFDSDGIRLVGQVSIGDAPLAAGLVEIDVVQGEQPRVSQALVQDGRFEVHRLRPGSVRLRLRAGLTLSPLGDPLVVEISGDDTTERVTWRLPGGRIAGQVLDAESGTPIAGACVRLQRSDARGERLDFGFALSGAAGQFEFEGLTEGTFSVVADQSLLGGERHAGARLEGLELAAGASLDEIELRARPGAGIEIVVAGAAGAPLAHALALAVDEDGHPIGSFPLAMTNAEGRAWLAGLPAGRTRVVVRHDRFVPGVSAVHDLIAGEHVAMRVDLRRGTAVEIEVVDAEGQPLAGAQVAVRWTGTPWIPASLFATPTGASIDLGHLPPGPCEFSVTHPRARFETAREIPAGARARLVLTP